MYLNIYIYIYIYIDIAARHFPGAQYDAILSTISHNTVTKNHVYQSVLSISSYKKWNRCASHRT